MVSSSGWRYQRLGHGQFRLFRLMPSLLGSDVPTGELLTVKVGDPVRYKVLSYTWNTPFEEQPFIRCDGGVIRVTTNLVQALRAVRHRSKMRLLWISAVCINQADTAEKFSQLVMMAKITPMAEGVILYVNS